MRYRFIYEHRSQWPVRLMCQVLQVSPGGYYTWRDRPIRAQQQRREVLKTEIEAIHQQFKQRYGSPRIHAELLARGQRCCVNTVAKLMRQHGIAAKSKRKFRCTTDSNHDLPVADNLLDRQFEPVAVNQVWVADITYIPTWEGWLYLAAVFLDEAVFHSDSLAKKAVAFFKISRSIWRRLFSARRRRSSSSRAGRWPLPGKA